MSLLLVHVRRGLMSILFLSTVSIGFAQTKDEAAVLRIFHKKFKWLIAKQSDSLNAMLDDRVQYIHSNGLTQSKQDVINDLHSGKLIYKNVELRDIQVRMYSNTAIVTGKGKFTGVVNDNPFDVDLLFTEVYVLKKKKWMLTSRHANRLP